MMGCIQQQRIMILSTILIALTMFPSVLVINAFTIQLLPVRTSPSSSSTTFAPMLIPTIQVRLGSSNTDEGTTDQTSVEEVSDNVEVVTDGSDVDTITEITAGSDETTVAPTVVEEDPEIIAMKEEIQKMEQEIKNSRRQLADINDRAEDYTKTGYARKVAEMENMRRARSMLQSSNKYTATAAILTEFLPAMDSLNSLKAQYETNEFGKMYNALPDAIRSGYTSMGCTEYTVETNTMFDANRMISIDMEPSTAVPIDCVIRTVIPGMELQGNMIRLAQVICSSGNGSSS